MALDLLDKSGNGNNLTNSGAAEQTASLPFSTNGNVRTAALVAAESDYLSAADSASLSITGNMTLMTWVNFDSLPADGNQMAPLAKWTTTGNQRSYRLLVSNSVGTYSITFAISTDGVASSNASVTWSPSPSTGTWYNIAVVYNASAGTADFYINGSAMGAQQSGLATSIFDSTALFVIGANQDGANSFINGKQDDIRVYNITRTQGQIAADYQQDLLTYTNVAGYWPFETPVESGGAAIFAYKTLLGVGQA